MVHVRRHEPRRRQRLHDALLAGGEQPLHVRDALVRVEAEQRVPSVGRRVRAARHGGERQGLEPRGAGLGRAREDDVAAPRGEAPLDGDDPGHDGRQHPGALVEAHPQLGVVGEALDGGKASALLMKGSGPTAPAPLVLVAAMLLLGDVLVCRLCTKAANYIEASMHNGVRNMVLLRHCFTVEIPKT